MRGQDEEDAEDVADPRERVQEVDLPRRVLRDEEVKQCERDRVSRKHIIPAGSNTLKYKST